MESEGKHMMYVLYKLYNKIIVHCYFRTLVLFTMSIDLNGVNVLSEGGEY